MSQLGISQRRRILVCLEDPGAANYVAPLPQLLATHAVDVQILAVGPARDYLRDLQTTWEPLPTDLKPKRLLQLQHPDLLITGTSENPASPCLALIEAARAAGVPSIGVVDAYPNAAHRFRGHTGDPLWYAPDWLFVPDAQTQSAFVDLGFRRRRAIVCGHPHHDVIQKMGQDLEAIGRAALRLKLLPNAPVSRPIIVFGTETPSIDDEVRLRNGTFTLTGFTGRRHRTEIVLEEFLAVIGRLPVRPYLVLRLHPKERTDDYREFLTYFDCVSHGGRPYELIYCADLVVGMSSMLLLEAAVMGRPTFSILPSASDKDWLPTIAAGQTPCVTTRAELAAAFPVAVARCKTIEVPDLGSVIRFGSATTVVNRLLSLLSGQSDALAA